MSTPSVTADVRREASRTILERMREKTNLVKFFLYNASAKHGVPIDGDEPFNLGPSEPAAPAPAAPTAPVVIQDTRTNGIGWGPLAVMSGVGAASVLAGAVGWSLLNGDKAEEVQPAPAAVEQDSTFRQSPYQFLEDSGGHLP